MPDAPMPMRDSEYEDVFRELLEKQEAAERQQAQNAADLIIQTEEMLIEAESFSIKDPFSAWALLKSAAKALSELISNGRAEASRAIPALLKRLREIAGTVAGGVGASSFYIEVGTSGISIGFNFSS